MRLALHDGAGGRRVDAGHQAQRRALARTVGADQRHGLARRDAEVEVAQLEMRLADVDRPPQHRADDELLQRRRPMPQR